MKKTPTWKSEKGAAMFLAAAVTLVMLIMTSLSVDLGGAYLERSRLSKAVDAAALAGARNSSGTDAETRRAALDVANANFNSKRPVSFDVTVDHPSTDATRVSVRGITDKPALLAGLIGHTKFDIGTTAEAMRTPIDLSFVLDISGSLEAQNAFDDLQDAAVAFLGYFDDRTDQVGIVTYSTAAQERMAVQKGFKSTGQSLIRSLSAISYTNTEEALRIAKSQLDVAPERTKVTKVVVLFTDGRPTAVRDVFPMDRVLEAPATFDGVVTTGNTSSAFQGLWQWQDGRRVLRFAAGVPVLGGLSGGASTPKPASMPNGRPVNGPNIRALGIQQSEEWAAQARAAGYVVYTVGLGNPRASDPLDQPDLGFLRRLANHGGMSDSSQPRGEMVFAPSAAELDNVFAKLADRILLRLTR